MKNIEITKVYNLVNANGDKLQLRYGKLMARGNEFRALLTSSEDMGLRWSFVGKKIPMPVRSRTWFNGFPKEIMIQWLNEQGWFVATEVLMTTGEAKTYELPEPNEEYLATDLVKDEEEFFDLVREMCRDGKALEAMHLCRYVHEVGTKEACSILHNICHE